MEEKRLLRRADLEGVDKSTNKFIGDQGEELAQTFLREKGYTILERNYRSGRCEIDIVCSKGDVLVFAEVKTRKNDNFGYPENFVSDRKIELFLETAELYIEKKQWLGESRFDIVSITNNIDHIEHIEDAFH